MSRRKLPEPWRTAMHEAGVPSYRKVADRAGIKSHETVRQMVLGLGGSDPKNVELVATALRVDVRTVSGWVNQSRSERGPYAPPSEADLLDHDERAAIDLMIRLLIRGRSTDDPPMTPNLTEDRAIVEQARADLLAQARNESARGTDPSDPGATVPTPHTL